LVELYLFVVSCLFVGFVDSNFDIHRHVTCEDCTSRVTGGLDPINNQVCVLFLKPLNNNY